MTNSQTEKGFPGGSVVKNLPGNTEDKEMGVQSLACEDPLDLPLANNSGILAWKIPWTEDPGGL